MHPHSLSITDFTYHLPEERIAHFPLEQRDASRLLIYQQGRITEDHYAAIASYIPDHTLMIFNNSKVVEARLLFQKTSGGIIEIFCLEPGDAYPDITHAMQQPGTVVWKCLVGGASKWKPGQVLEKKIALASGELILQATLVEKKADHFVIRLEWQPAHFSFAEVLHLAGAIPLPPYIKRKAEASDADRYQTIYAGPDGSVAAPTAGLHFTTAIFDSLRAKQIETGFVTLHVGAGTFKPVKASTMAEHTMHAEFIDVDAALLRQLLQHKGPLVAVGTTSLRTLESLYWLGVKLILQKNTAGEMPMLQQWDAYQLNTDGITTAAALNALLHWMENQQTTRLITRTQLLIAPGYSFKLVDGLVTNFHQPQSTLLLLVAALVGNDWKKIYNYALDNNFRFLSYGDGNLLWRTA